MGVVNPIKWSVGEIPAENPEKNKLLKHAGKEPPFCSLGHKVPFFFATFFTPPTKGGLGRVWVPFHRKGCVLTGQMSVNLPKQTHS